MTSSRKFISIATAHTQAEVIRIRMLLDRAQVPYQTKGETFQSIYPLAGISTFAVDFLIPAELEQQARESLEAVFEIETDLPESCPACGTRTVRGRMDCAECGLFLG